MDQVKITPQDLELESYNYELPSELIADRPAPGRSSSRLLVVNAQSGVIEHQSFKDIIHLLPKGSTLVFNQSKVFPCRLIGAKPTGGEVEAFVLSLIPKNGFYQVLLKAAGKRRVGEIFHFEELTLELMELGEEGTFWVKPNLDSQNFLNLLEKKGGIPIPPYIRNGVSDDQDKKDYQTVYAKDSGSVAAPTAGLHFTPELLEELKQRGIQTAFVTLHVGLGTFKPVKTEKITDHKMHAENFYVDPEEAKKIKAAEGKIFAVGTTSLRVLESCWGDNGFQFPTQGEMQSTRIFLHPGKPVHSIQGLITNFHLPQSSLLMLVSALLGREKTLEIYKTAVQERYRFFSYGDAMLFRRML
ncbi:MAG: tRNA preQ1(34) S-adenosylmethionine ribosyltransferase-isomerase QueA [Bacteriovoracaceae bacterium]|nr:tRNA preQ1(34) S-adenosylmethionine ribosyltransferase-isomerase QueA [Bacteriovoracaceae bacterium]